jgi:sigma-E factor negative regulatory protein RseA
VTEVKKESLSALIDGEASEIEIHRLVREFRSDESLTRSWAIYQQIRTSLRSSGEAQLTPGHHESLFNRISEAVHAEEDVHDHVSTVNRSSKKVVFGGLALAASLVVAVFVGVQTATAPGGGQDVALNESIAGAGAGAGVESPVDVQRVAFQPDIQDTTSELVELDEEKQRRLRAYLNQHDRMSRMDNNNQLVNYQKPTKK